jgi:YidC/Oxa1 family membrane protein insertase
LRARRPCFIQETRVLDDNRDKEMMRNQLIAIIIMTVATVVWFNYFMPQPPPVQPLPPQPFERVAREQPDPVVPAEAVPVPAPGGPWVDVAPAAPAADPAEDEVVLINEHLRLVFTRVGARLKQAEVLLGRDEHFNERLVPLAPEGVPDASARYPLGLEFADQELGRGFNLRRFEADPDRDGLGVTFSITLPERMTLRKIYRLNQETRVLQLRVELENHTPGAALWGMDQVPAYKLLWEPDLAASDSYASLSTKYLVWRQAGKTSSDQLSGLPTGGPDRGLTVREPDWVGVKSLYFLVAMRPEFSRSTSQAFRVEDFVQVALTVPRFTVDSMGVEGHSFEIYLGPMQLDSLREAWPNLTTSLRFFESIDIMDWFAKLLLSVLHWFYQNTIPNYGVAIILLTIVVRTILFPLTLKSIRSMKKMQLLAPEMEKLKAEYGDNAQEYQKKIMETYKERGINPLGGCLPMLLQMPIFFALYRMLWHAFELRGAPFFGHIQDLSKPDKLIQLPFMEFVPLIGNHFNSVNVLPILMGLAMVLNTKILPPSGPMQNPQQKFIMNFMPVFFALICYNMAAGLNLYILTSTILGIVQQFFIRTGEVKAEPKKKPKTVGKRQHWYTAAKARQRQSARELKRKKQR